MRGSEDDIDEVTLPMGLGGYKYLPAVTTAQLVSAAAWLSAAGHPCCELSADTAGYLHVTFRDERAVFALDGFRRVVTVEVDIAAGDALTQERASVLDRDIRAVCQGIRRVWIHLAGDLSEFHDDRCWEVLGYDTFEQWLATPEIDIGRRHAYRMIQAYRELVVERGVPLEALEAAEVTKVAVVLPALKAGKVSAEDALSDAATLSRSDLAERYAGDLEVPIDAAEEWHDCPDCGRSHKAKRA